MHIIFDVKTIYAMVYELNSSSDVYNKSQNVLLGIKY